VKPGGLLLTPGAGSGADHRTLVALARALEPLPVARVDFPYRKAGRKAPDRPPVLLQTVIDEAGSLVSEAGIDPGSLVLGGRSMGGRICSMAVADGLPAGGLVLLSYPLHPPGKPERARVEHFPALKVPVLFVSGTADPFGTPAEFEAAAEEIPGPVTFHWLDRQRHDPRGADEEITAAVKDWLADLR
jgi:uncharacterized protein